MKSEKTVKLDMNIAARFAEEGYAVCEGFYNFIDEIKPIQEGIQSIIELVGKKYGIAVPASTPEEAMAKGYPALIAQNRAYGSEVYDAVKQLPSFVSLVASGRNVALFEKLRVGATTGIAGGGFGIRIDNPQEELFSAPWHQEFPAQLRSLDGVVFWSPLLPMKVEMGPVKMCPGSHREGVVPVYEDDGGIGKVGAYALRLDRESERISKYTSVAPLTKPGDLLVMDFLTLHASGNNVSQVPRWTMQWRLFNFADPTGMKISWRGSFAAGVRFQDVLPELTVTRPVSP
jgi:ectoine hydroxylase-related dioxygenase (phytanoyl-CoA dioxygenase family)